MNKPLVLTAAAAATLVVVMLWGKILALGAHEPAAKAVAFVPDPNSDKRIVVSGWTDGELKRILEDFAKLYALDRSFASRVTSGGAEAIVISFPNDIPSDVFFFLVNYLNYPEAYEPSGRHIAVAGKATLSASFDLPESSLVVKSARVYVPENDEDFDLVYVTLRSGESYEVSFTDHRWRTVQEARMPEAVREL